MVQELIDKQKTAFEHTIGHFTEEAAKIRTGRANPGLVEHLLVEYYGVKTPLKQIASIHIPEARQIVIAPWDKGNVQAIETALRESDLGLNPGNDGTIIRIVLPPLTEERRKDLVKALNQRAEESRIAIRTVREEVWKEIQSLESGGQISEDDKFQGKDELQKIVDAYNDKIEGIRKKKEEEILTV